MKIGLIKDRKKDENRVALQPIQVKELVNLGHEVLVENDAGLNSGYTDDEYKACGATIVEKKEILDKCKLLLKVKAPLESEYNDFKKHHILFTYLHFDENILPEKINELIKSIQNKFYLINSSRGILYSADIKCSKHEFEEKVTSALNKLTE